MEECISIHTKVFLGVMLLLLLYASFLRCRGFGLWCVIVVYQLPLILTALLHVA